jgi:metal-responsive CopG/Arc/MetJ family transcriptional regulator
MTAAKRKISVSLDADLVDELERGGDALSKQVNDAIREAVVRQRRRRLLAELLGELDRRHGPVKSTLVEKYEKLLG